MCKKNEKLAQNMIAGRVYGGLMSSMNGYG